MKKKLMIILVVIGAICILLYQFGWRKTVAIYNQEELRTGEFKVISLYEKVKENHIVFMARETGVMADFELFSELVGMVLNQDLPHKNVALDMTMLQAHYLNEYIRTQDQIYLKEFIGAAAWTPYANAAYVVLFNSLKGKDIFFVGLEMESDLTSVKMYLKNRYSSNNESSAQEIMNLLDQELNQGALEKIRTLIESGSLFNSEEDKRLLDTMIYQSIEANRGSNHYGHIFVKYESVHEADWLVFLPRTEGHFNGENNFVIGATFLNTLERSFSGEYFYIQHQYAQSEAYFTELKPVRTIEDISIRSLPKISNSRIFALDKDLDAAPYTLLRTMNVDEKYYPHAIILIIKSPGLALYY